MPAGFTIETESVDNLGEKAKKAQKKRLERAATIGFNWSVEQAPEDRGQLKQSAFPPEWRGHSLVWGYTAPYAEAQEEGTAPFYPPVKPLLEWSERVTGDKGLGYYVAREKLPEEGIEPKHFARDGAEKQKQALKGKSFNEIFEEEL